MEYPLRIETLKLVAVIPNNEIRLNGIQGLCKSIEVIGISTPYRLRLSGMTVSLESENGILHMKDVIREALEYASKVTGNIYNTVEDTIPDFKELLYTQCGGILTVNSIIPDFDGYPKGIHEICVNMTRFNEVALVFRDRIHSEFEVVIERYICD